MFFCPQSASASGLPPYTESRRKRLGCDYRQVHELEHDLNRMVVWLELRRVRTHGAGRWLIEDRGGFPVFNVGCGSALCADGSVEMSAVLGEEPRTSESPNHKLTSPRPFRCDLIGE